MFETDTSTATLWHCDSAKLMIPLHICVPWLSWHNDVMTALIHPSYHCSYCPVSAINGGKQHRRHIGIIQFMRPCSSHTHTHTMLALQRAHTYKHTNSHLSMANSKLCLVIVYLTDDIDLTELEESLWSLGLLRWQLKKGQKFSPSPSDQTGIVLM